MEACSCRCQSDAQSTGGTSRSITEVLKQSAIQCKCGARSSCGAISARCQSEQRWLSFSPPSVTSTTVLPVSAGTAIKSPGFHWWKPSTHTHIHTWLHCKKISPFYASLYASVSDCEEWGRTLCFLWGVMVDLAESSPGFGFRFGHNQLSGFQGQLKAPLV